MKISATELLIQVLDKIDAKIKYLENSPYRLFVLIEYETISLFHRFNMYFKDYWDGFDYSSASQLFKYMEISERFSDLCERYENMLIEQNNYLMINNDFQNKYVDKFPPAVFSERIKDDFIGYYKDYFDEVDALRLKPIYEIGLSSGETFENRYERRSSRDVKYYELRCDGLYEFHYNALINTLYCLDTYISIISFARKYPPMINAGYMPSQEEIINALETGLCQYAKENGMNVERDLQKTAQLLKPSRNALLNSIIWGNVMEEEDDLYDLAISNQLEDNNEKRFEFVNEELRKQLTDNALLLKIIKSNAVDGELFDIRLSVETNNLLSSLNADNLDLFYELILRRNIIQREMFPVLKAQYDAWPNNTEEQPEEINEIQEIISRDHELPTELKTEKAEELWKQLREAGFIIADGYDLAEGVSNNQAAYIAFRFREKLGYKFKWKPFIQLWGIKNMAQFAGNWQKTGIFPPRAKDIDEIFGVKYDKPKGYVKLR